MNNIRIDSNLKFFNLHDFDSYKDCPFPYYKYLPSIDRWDYYECASAPLDRVTNKELINKLNLVLLLSRS